MALQQSSDPGTTAIATRFGCLWIFALFKASRAFRPKSFLSSLLVGVGYLFSNVNDAVRHSMKGSNR